MARDVINAIDEIVRNAALAQHLPGLSIAVTVRDEILFERGYGFRNIGEALAADSDTIYRIASVSKQFTAAALLQLAERGALRLDDRIGHYFPWFPYGDSIELQHLLSHTSGIPDYFPLGDFDRIGFTPAAPREVAQAVLDRPPAFAPGAEYQYCNTGYVLLGAVIELVAGLSYSQYLQKHIIEPLELTRTGVDELPIVQHNVAVGYTSYVLGPWELARDYDPSWKFATGGLYSTVVDMLAWNRALRSGRVVTSTSLTRMTTPTRLLDGRNTNYGLGLNVGEAGGRREIRHTGGLPGTSTDNATYPDDGIDIVVFVNHDGCSTYSTITQPILALLLNEPRLAAPRTPRAPVSSGLHERDETQGWIRLAASGAIHALPLSAKFRRWLRPDRHAQFANLRKYGALTGLTRIDAGRRDPETTFSYHADFESGPLLATIALLDDGTISHLGFSRWDSRA